MLNITQFLLDYKTGKPVDNPTIHYINDRGQLRQGKLISARESLNNPMGNGKMYHFLKLVIETDGGTKRLLTIEYFSNANQQPPAWDQLYYPNYQTA